jgi:hypothetical protein
LRTAALIDLRGIGHAEPDPIQGDQTQAPVKSLWAHLGQWAQDPLEEFFEHDKGQGLPPLTEIAFAHGDAQQPKQMFPQSASPSHRVMEEDGGQQLASTQDLNGATGSVLALLESIEIGPVDSLQEQG